MTAADRVSQICKSVACMSVEATKRAMVRAARAIASAMRMVGNEEGDGKDSKGNGDGKEDGGR